MAKKKDLVLDGAAADGENITAPFSRLVIDEAFNVRQSYDKQKLADLVELIRESGGLLTPLTVNELPPKEKGGEIRYYVLAGFRRCRALRMIHGEEAVMKVEVPMRVIKCAVDSDDAIFASIAVDGGHEPVRKYDLANRLTWMRQERKMENKVIAARTGIGPMTVSQLITCRTKLCEEVQKVWRAAPTADKEIKFTTLLEWARHEPEEQVKALAAYMESGPEDEGEEGGAGKKKRAKKPKQKTEILWKPRSKKVLVTRLKEYIEQLKEDKDKPAKEKMTDGEKAGYATLRWVLQDLTNFPNLRD